MHEDREKNETLISKSIFVTVGTTLFDRLVEAADDTKFLDIVSSRNYNNLIIQYGKGNHEPFSDSNNVGIKMNNMGNEIKCEKYRFKPSLRDDISRANLIISHAGAGSIMEGLAQCRNKKNAKLIVVINSKLMNNHQQELAGALASRGHLICLTEPNLLTDESFWRENIDNWEGKDFPEGDGGHDFAELVDECMCL